MGRSIGLRAPPHHMGMALVAVLWIVAALSIIASGLSKSLRSEGRIVSLARQQVEAQALGDAAINIALQAVLANGSPVSQLQEVDVLFRGVNMDVQLMPLNGLIDLNNASQVLLERLFIVAGGVPSQLGQQLAQAVMEFRMSRDSQGRVRRFESTEELMEVPGVGYDLYARLEKLLTADIQGSGRVNALAAPIEVLAILGNGDVAAASRIEAQRLSGAVGIDFSSLDGSLMDQGITRRLRVQARVPTSEGTVIRVSRSVDLSGRPLDGSPWQTFRTTLDVESISSTTP